MLRGAVASDASARRLEIAQGVSAALGIQAPRSGGRKIGDVARELLAGDAGRRT